MSKKKPEFLTDHDKAFDTFSFTVQCGDCYVYYSAEDQNGVCPNCGGTEWVGSR